LSAETVPRAFTTKQVPDIPLHLIPKTIADLIKGRRSPLYRITVTMAFKNRFTLVIETRKRGYRRFAPRNPEHQDKVIWKTKQEALAKEEHYNGKPTE
jgi:hypothetical protein